MAEQSVSNERKKELEQIDPFQANLLKPLAYVKGNKKQFSLILGTIIVVVIIFSGIMFGFKKSENVASDLVAKAVITYTNANDPIKGYQATKDDFEHIFVDYSNTSAGKMAKVEFAKICFDAGKYDRAFELYKDGLEIFKNEAGMKNFLLVSLGNVCLARNDFDLAKSYFLQVETGSSSLLKDEARFALADLYETSNDMKSGLKMYEKIVKDNGNSIYKSIAESKVKDVQ
ncbi:MAG: tetratricopeptide repeat protein [Desulfobacteraceae bacterium]|nr:tetratricopeptide repeat protein [Desulfobacteraceae bacterium]